jgi:hypothetical protein
MRIEINNLKTIIFDNGISSIDTIQEEYDKLLSLIKDKIILDDKIIIRITLIKKDEDYDVIVNNGRYLIKINKEELTETEKEIINDFVKNHK